MAGGEGGGDGDTSHKRQQDVQFEAHADIVEACNQTMPDNTREGRGRDRPPGSSMKVRNLPGRSGNARRRAARSSALGLRARRVWSPHARSTLARAVQPSSRRGTPSRHRWPARCARSAGVLDSGCADCGRDRRLAHRVPLPGAAPALPHGTVGRHRRDGSDRSRTDPAGHAEHSTHRPPVK